MLTSGPCRDRGSNPQYKVTPFPRHWPRVKSPTPTSPALGGLRGQLRHTPPAVNAFWENQSFHNYADYAMTEAFRTGLAELRDLGTHALRSDVRGSRVVAMPSPHHHRLFDRIWRDGVSYPARGAH